MSKVIPADDFSAYYLPSMGAIVTDLKTVPRPITPIIKSEDSDLMALWGPQNDFPQQVIADVRQDPELPNLLDEKARLLYSSGLIYGKLVKGGDGTETLEPLPDALNKEIEDWLRRTNINRYIYEGAKDLYWFFNVFPEVILSVDRKKIIQLCIQPAEHCRWSKQNPSSGLVDTCYINANFPVGKVTDKLTKKIPTIDPYYDPASFLLQKTGTNFIYPLSIPTPGSQYYQLADWNSIRASGWLDISRAIPKFKKALLEKQMTIKYHIEISNLFWEKKYEGFDSKTPEEKAVIKKTELDNFQKVMAGAAETGNNLYTSMITDPALGKEYALWKITVLDDKLKDGTYLEDGKEASLYKYSAINIHPALRGTMPNSGMGGAGSNIREAYLLHMLNARAHQDIILEPLNNLVVYYNNWTDCTFRFRNSFLNTLDKGSQTSTTLA